MEQLKKLGWLALFTAMIWIIIANYLDLWPLNQRETNLVWTTIVHSDYNFSIEYATRWHVWTYGQDGYQGDDDLKLRFSTGPPIRISLRHRNQPTFDQALAWGDASIGDSYQEIERWTDEIDGQPVIRRVFSNEWYTIQHVYILRENDMLLIELTSSDHDYEYWLDTFERVVQSFHSLE